MPATRRNFGRVVAASALSPLVGRPGGVEVDAGGGGGIGAAPLHAAAGDSVLAEFVAALDAPRRGRLILRGDDPRRGMVQNHWAIVAEPIAALSAPQQDLAMALIRQVLTDAAFERWTRQRHDDAGGWKHDHLALFTAADGSGPAEWVVTGRHLTLRGLADGSVPAGPLFWGHTATGPASLGHTALTTAENLLATLSPADQRSARLDALAARSAPAGLRLDALDTAGQDAARQLIAALAEPFRALARPAGPSARNEERSLAGVRWQAFGPSDRPLVAWRVVGPGWRWSVHTEPHFHSWFEAV